MERNDSSHDATTESAYAKGSNANRIALARQAARKAGGEYSSKHETTGWRPTCDHDGDPVPATVLDPFVGSGTTVAVAQTLGRRGVGVDLNTEYLDIAVKRMSGIPLPMRI